MIPLEQLKESSFYQYIVEEGRQEGMQQEAVIMLRRPLERRFGALPEWAARKLEAADRTTVEDWGVRLLAAESLENVLR